MLWGGLREHVLAGAGTHVNVHVFLHELPQGAVGFGRRWLFVYEGDDLVQGEAEIGCWRYLKSF